MKNRLLILILGTATSNTLTITNNQGPVATIELLTSSGASAAGFTVSAGTFTGSFDFNGVTSVSDLTNAFTLYDGATGSVTDSPFTGVFNINSGATNFSTSGEVFLYAYNASEAFVAKFDGSSFPSSGADAPSTLILGSDLSTILVGSTDGSSFFTTALGAAVPEPTTLTLAGLGALALVTRRRRA